MAADLNTSKVGEIMRKFENDNGTQIPKDLLDRVHDVIVGKLMEIWNFVLGPFGSQKAFPLMNPRVILAGTQNKKNSRENAVLKII